MSNNSVFVLPEALSEKSPSGIFVKMPLLRVLNLKGNPCDPDGSSDEESGSGDDDDDEEEEEEGGK